VENRNAEPWDSEGLRIFCAPAAVRHLSKIVKRILDEVSTFATDSHSAMT